MHIHNSVIKMEDGFPEFKVSLWKRAAKNLVRVTIWAAFTFLALNVPLSWGPWQVLTIFWLGMVAFGIARIWEIAARAYWYTPPPTLKATFPDEKLAQIAMDTVKKKYPKAKIWLEENILYLEA